jgi:putative heme iron utilization protein
MNDLAVGARRFVRACDSGALATLSRRHPGYPFGSVVSFVADHLAAPVILISGLAEHSLNLKADRRTSLLVRESGAEPQSAARVTLVADGEEMEPGQDLLERYLRYVPAARRLLDLGDFFFVRLHPVAIRYIAGFGAIYWVALSDYEPPRSQIADTETQLLNSIGQEQADELEALCRRRLGRDPASVEMIGVDCDGLDVRADGARLRFDFPAPMLSAADAQRAVAALAGEGR